jgi:MYXO-CTERM domain-containing protein
VASVPALAALGLAGSALISRRSRKDKPFA